MKKSYSINNLLNFTIELPEHYKSLGLSKYITKQYENFLIPEVIKPDLEISISEYKTNNIKSQSEQLCFLVDDKTLVWREGINTTGSYKQAHWRVIIDGLFTNHITVSLSCNLPGYLVITGKVIDQILAFSLATKGGSLIHAASVENKYGIHLIAGSSGTGKTSITLFLTEKQYKFLGDNFALIKDGTVESFLTPLNIFTYNLSKPLRQRLNQQDLFHLWWRRLLFRLTGGYIKLFMKINPTNIWSDLIGKKAPLRTILLLISGTDFNVMPITYNEMIESLLYNMKLELQELNTWMTRHNYVFQNFSEQGWWEEYRKVLLKNIPEKVKFIKAEVPPQYDHTVLHSIYNLLDEISNDC